MKRIFALLIATSMLSAAAPASAALVTKHFRFVATFAPDSGSPVDILSGTINLTFDNAANIFGSTENFSLSGFDLPISNPAEFSYNASTNMLIFGTDTSPYAYGTRRTHHDFGFFYNVANDSIATLGFTNASGNFYLSRAVDVTAVPEPASWAMMIGGFALIGGVMRRRTRTVAFA